MRPVDQVPYTRSLNLDGNGWMEDWFPQYPDPVDASRNICQSDQEQSCGSWAKSRSILDIFTVGTDGGVYHSWKPTRPLE